MFWARHAYGSNGYVLSDMTETGPPALPGSSYPVVWLHCGEDIAEHDGATLDAMLHSVTVQWPSYTVQGMSQYDYTVSDSETSVDSYNCAGIEADICIVQCSGYAAIYYYEMLS